MAWTCKRLIYRCFHGPLLQVTPKPTVTVQPCDGLEKALKIAAFAQLRNLRSTDPARAKEIPTSNPVTKFLATPKKLLINGKWVAAASGKTFEVTEPGDGPRDRPRGRRR
jgi:hypothetical protein